MLDLGSVRSVLGSVLGSVRSAAHTKIFAVACLLVLFIVYQYGSKQAVASSSMITLYSVRESQEQIEGDEQQDGREDPAGRIEQLKKEEAQLNENLQLQEHDSQPESESDQIEIVVTNSTPKTNLMFVKTHKCGTSTLVNIFYLYGVRRKLNFALKPYKHKLAYGSLEKLKKNMPLVPPRPGGTWNIQCQHGVFFPEVEHMVLPKETSLYTTVVRSPISHFKSAFNFFSHNFAMKEKYGKNITMDESIEFYLQGKPAPTAGEVHLNNALNSAALDLGWNNFIKERKGTVQAKIDAFIAHLDSEMDFVLITDRIDESLVILAHLLGWEMTDILYLNRMVSAKLKEAPSPLLESTKETILKYQIIDSQIFAHFNASFERHIDAIGRERFHSLVAEFRELRQNFEDKCFDKTQVIKGPYGSTSYKLSWYALNKNLACVFLQTRDTVLTRVVTQLQLSQDYKLEIERALELQDIVVKVQQEYGESVNISSEN